MTETAVILVAGRGTRLRPLTDDSPKALVRVGNESILERAVRLLAGCGVREFVLATGYREDAVRRSMAELGQRATFVHNPHWDSTQNAVSLALCGEVVAGRSFFKLDGDVLFESAVLERLERSSAGLAVAVDGRGPLDSEAMKVCVSAPPRIDCFGKGLDPRTATAETIGIERVDSGFSQELFQALLASTSAGRTHLYYEDIYSELVAERRVEAHAIEVGDRIWAEIDDPADLERATALFGTQHDAAD